jgi:hypothetical protein
MVLEHRQHDAVARPQIGAAPALRDEVDAFGRAADDTTSPGDGRADEAGDAAARGLEGEGHFGGAPVDAAMDGGVGFGIADGDGVDHRFGFCAVAAVSR